MCPVPIEIDKYSVRVNIHFISSVSFTVCKSVLTQNALRQSSLVQIGGFQLSLFLYSARTQIEELQIVLVLPN